MLSADTQRECTQGQGGAPLGEPRPSAYRLAGLPVMLLRRQTPCRRGPDSDGEVEANDGAVAPAHHVRLGSVQPVEQGDHVVGHEVEAIWAGVARAAAVPAAIHDDDGVTRSESLDLIAPIGRVSETTVQKDDRRTVADRCAIEADAIDLSVAGVLAGDRGRSWRQGPPPRLTTGGMERKRTLTPWPSGDRSRGSERILNSALSPILQ
jgi:hypothetical protein